MDSIANSSPDRQSHCGACCLCRRHDRLRGGFLQRQDDQPRRRLRGRRRVRRLCPSPRPPSAETYSRQPEHHRAEHAGRGLAHCIAPSGDIAPKDGTVATLFDFSRSSMPSSIPKRPRSNPAATGSAGSARTSASAMSGASAASKSSLAAQSPQGPYGPDGGWQHAGHRFKVLKRMLGVNVKPVLGYAGTAAQYIAIERGEVDAGAAAGPACRRSGAWRKDQAARAARADDGRQHAGGACPTPATWCRANAKERAQAVEQPGATRQTVACRERCRRIEWRSYATRSMRRCRSGAAGGSGTATCRYQSENGAGCRGHCPGYLCRAG